MAYTRRADRHVADTARLRRPLTAAGGCPPGAPGHRPARSTWSRRSRGSWESKPCRRYCPRTPTRSGAGATTSGSAGTLVDVLCGAGLSSRSRWRSGTTSMPDRLRLAPDIRVGAVRVVNPMSAEQTHLRTLVFPGLLTSLARNLSVGADAVALFEVAQVVLPADAADPRSAQRIAGVMTGPGIELRRRPRRGRDAVCGAPRSSLR